MEIQPTSHFDRKQIGSLHMIRGIACLLVILCHTQGTEFGQTGVDFFLVISGFVMMMSTDKVGGGGTLLDKKNQTHYPTIL